MRASARATEDRSGLHVDIVDILADLKLNDRQLLGLRYVAGMDSKEIGAVLGISPQGARTRLHRLIARLRSDYGD